MVLDYSERKPAGKNRPRKQPVGMLVLILLSAVSLSYVLGLATGWFLFKSRGKLVPATSATAGSVAGGATAAQQPAFTNPDATASRGGDPPLTFFETLPKGGKAVIGSGLNPKKSDALPEPHSGGPAPQAGSLQTVAPAATAAPEMPRDKAVPPTEQSKKSVPPPGDGLEKFCVQVASSQDRKEADALKDKLAAKGFSAYVEESKIAGKGTWYRVRIGRHLDQKAASGLAGRVGKGALVIPE